MRIFGIDPGVKPGYAILDADSNGQRPKLVHYGAIKTSTKDVLEARCLAIYQAFLGLIGEWRPDVAAIEKIFVARSPQSALTLGHARCAAMIAVAQCAKPLYPLDASHVKQVMTGNGRAKKPAMQAAVKDYFGLSEIIKNTDANDAVAIGLTLWVVSRRPGGLNRDAPLFTDLRVRGLPAAQGGQLFFFKGEK